MSGGGGGGGGGGWLSVREGCVVGAASTSGEELGGYVGGWWGWWDGGAVVGDRGGMGDGQGSACRACILPTAHSSPIPVPLPSPPPPRSTFSTRSKSCRDDRTPVFVSEQTTFMDVQLREERDGEFLKGKSRL